MNKNICICNGLFSILSQLHTCMEQPSKEEWHASEDVHIQDAESEELLSEAEAALRLGSILEEAVEDISDLLKESSGQPLFLIQCLSNLSTMMLKVSQAAQQPPSTSTGMETPSSTPTTGLVGVPRSAKRPGQTFTLATKSQRVKFV